MIGATSALIESYLAAGQLDLARLLVGELRDREPDAAARYDAEIERATAASARETEEAARLRAEHDPAVSARERKLAMRALFGFALVSASAVTAGRIAGITRPPPWTLVAFSIVILLAYAGVVLAFRRFFFKNRINQTMAALLGGLLGVVGAHRFYGFAVGLEIPVIVAGDLFLAAVMSLLSAAILRDLRLVATCAILFIGGVVATAIDSGSLVVLGISAVVAIVFLLLAPHRAHEGS